MPKHIKILTLTFVVFSLTPATTWACKVCLPLTMVPKADTTIPSTTKHLFISGTQLTEESVVELIKVSDMTTVPVEIDKGRGIVTPSALEENTDYIVKHKAPYVCGQIKPPMSFPFRTTTAANVPETNIALPLNVSDVAEKEVTYSPSECNIPVKSVGVTLSTTLPDDLKPWKNLLRWHIEAGGLQFHAEDGVGDLYASCDTKHEVGVKEGEHNVRLVATLIGTDKVWRSASQKVNLECDATSLGCNSVRSKRPQSPMHMILFFVGLMSLQFWRRRT